MHGRLLKKLLDAEDGSWDRYVPAAQLYYDIKEATILGSDAFSVMFTRRANLLTDHTGTQDAVVTYEDIRRRLQWAGDVVFPAVRGRQASHASAAIAQFARRHRILPDDPFPHRHHGHDEGPYAQ
ncbi:Uncharacterized protein PBTT_09515 [Plasmodiophora brassicae]